MNSGLHPQATAPSNSNENTSAPQGGESALGMAWKGVREYLHITRQLLTHPSLFFRNLPSSTGVIGPLTYALLTHWIGTAVQFTWISWAGKQVLPWFKELFGKLFIAANDIGQDLEQIDSLGRHAQKAILPFQEKWASWAMGVAPVLLDPFTHILSLVFMTSLVWVGARLLVTPGKNGAPSEVRFESALQILCFASAASVLNIVPLVGSGLETLFGTLLAIIGVREVWKTSTFKAIVIALFPKILVVGALFSIVGATFFLLFQWAMSAFSG
jgi:hypothetical protein